MEEVIVAQHRTVNYANGYNFAIESTDRCFDDLYSTVLDSVCRRHRHAFQQDLSISPRNRRTCWAFVLDENRPAVGIWHNHLRTSTYNAVYYLRTSIGDAIDLIIPNDVRNPRAGREVEIPVQEGMLIVMPGWLFHKEKPIQQHRDALRISINVEVISSGVPIPELLTF